jgi:hypothetical protein
VPGWPSSCEPGDRIGWQSGASSLVLTIKPGNLRRPRTNFGVRTILNLPHINPGAVIGGWPPKQFLSAGASCLLESKPVDLAQVSLGGADNQVRNNPRACDERINIVPCEKAVLSHQDRAQSMGGAAEDVRVQRVANHRESVDLHVH